MLNWLLQNKEWVFSGVGVGNITVFLTWLISRRPVARFPSLQVDLAFGCLTFGPELSDQMLPFTVANPGERPIQIAGIKVPLKKRGLFFPELGGERRLSVLLGPVKNSAISAGTGRSQSTSRMPIGGDAVSTL
jgi:hypothetical protein